MEEPIHPMRFVTLSQLRRETGAMMIMAMLAGCNRNAPSSAPATAAAPAPAPAPIAPGQPTPGEFYVEGDLPPPEPEVQVVSPGPGFVWIAGCWGWRDGGRIWERGHWERPPHAHAEWVSPRWDRRGRGHVFVRGYWR